MLTDTHCHLNFSCFTSTLPTLISDAKQSGITQFIIPSTDASRWQSIEKLSDDFNCIYYALGIHPRFLKDFKKTDLNLLSEKLKLSPKKCVAIGEIGLDKFSEADDQQQELVFIEQLKIAIENKLPIILHVVKNQQRVIEILKQLNFKEGGVYHGFSGSLEVANEFIKLGFKLGVGGVITYPNSTKTRKTVSEIPLSAIVLETDAPDMPLYQQKNAINTPQSIHQILDELILLRSETKEIITAQIKTNTKMLFRKLT